MPIISVNQLTEEVAEIVEFYMALARENPPDLYYSATFSKYIYRMTRILEQRAPEYVTQHDLRIHAAMVALSDLLHKGYAQRTVDDQGRIVITPTARAPEVHGWEIGVLPIIRDVPRDADEVRAGATKQADLCTPERAQRVTGLASSELEELAQQGDLSVSTIGSVSYFHLAEIRELAEWRTYRIEDDRNGVQWTPARVH